MFAIMNEIASLNRLIIQYDQLHDIFGRRYFYEARTIYKINTYQYNGLQCKTVLKSYQQK